MSFGKVVTAMITPFTPTGEVDYDEALRLGHYLVENGTDTLLLAGTTGESPTLSHDEEFKLFRLFVSEFKGKVPIMAGTGSNSTSTAIASSKEAEAIGVDALLQVVPYYNKPSQEGIYQHFKAVAESVSLPIMLYNIPGRTGVNMLPETVARLSKISNIVSVKEASGLVQQVEAIRGFCDASFEIYSGDDGLTLEFIKKGACGVVSVASHCVGLDIQKLVTAALSGNRDAATRIHNRLEDLFKVLFITSNPAPVKYALSQMGFSVGATRLPLVPVDASEKSQIDTVLKQLQII